MKKFYVVSVYFVSEVVGVVKIVVSFIREKDVREIYFEVFKVFMKLNLWVFKFMLGFC